MCGCSWEKCIVHGARPMCSCSCHRARDHDLMRAYQQARMRERCANCRWAPLTCSRGLCYCECHGDRPQVQNPETVVQPGHDADGHELAFPHLHVHTPVSPDLDRLISLREQYKGTHPEHTIGGAQ